ncbi:MAG TPA: DHA2 family efflux MFS transporter permease subunit [Actinoplanes sp.]|nr:DHA2 family efflux MFS transporter permease subunit [Actinoplanes sp.]
MIKSSPPATATAGRTQSRQWWVLGILAIAQLMIILDVTIVNIALPAAQADLGFADDSRQWVITAYSLAFGALLILGGRIGDRFGRRTTFLVGTAGFAVASVLGGLAGNFEVLIAARALQGVFGALMAPAALGLLTVTFAGSPARGKAFGVWGAITGAGGALGLLLGGVLTDYLSWRWCLLVNVIFAAAALAGYRILPAGTSAQRTRIDVISAAIVSAGLFGIVYGFARAETDGWSDTGTIGSLIAGAVLVAIFVVRQARVADPLLPLRVLADRFRAGALVAVFTAGAGVFGVFLFLTYFMQLNLGFSAARSGTAFLPLVVTLGITATLAGARVLPRTGPLPLFAVGTVATTTAMIMMTRFSAATTYWPDVLVPLLIAGVGLGLNFTAAMGTATLGIQARDAGVGSALINTAQQIGGSIGVALLSTQSAAAGTDYVTEHLTPAGPTPQLLADAALAGYHTAFWWAAGFFVVGGLICLILIPRGRPATATTATPPAMH